MMLVDFGFLDFMKPKASKELESLEDGILDCDTPEEYLEGNGVSPEDGNSAFSTAAKDILRRGFQFGAGDMDSWYLLDARGEKLHLGDYCSSYDYHGCLIVERVDGFKNGKIMSESSQSSPESVSKILSVKEVQERLIEGLSKLDGYSIEEIRNVVSEAFGKPSDGIPLLFLLED